MSDVSTKSKTKYIVVAVVIIVILVLTLVIYFTTTDKKTGPGKTPTTKSSGIGAGPPGPPGPPGPISSGEVVADVRQVANQLSLPTRDNQFSNVNDMARVTLTPGTWWIQASSAVWGIATTLWDVAVTDANRVVQTSTIGGVESNQTHTNHSGWGQTRPSIPIIVKITASKTFYAGVAIFQPDITSASPVKFTIKSWIQAVRLV